MQLHLFFDDPMVQVYDELLAGINNNNHKKFSEIKENQQRKVKKKTKNQPKSASYKQALFDVISCVTNIHQV